MRSFIVAAAGRLSNQTIRGLELTCSQAASTSAVRALFHWLAIEMVRSVVDGCLLQLKGSSGIWRIANVVESISLVGRQYTRNVLQLHGVRQLVGWDQRDWSAIGAGDEVCNTRLALNYWKRMVLSHST